MKVSLLVRKSFKGQYSIENIFREVKNCIESDIDCDYNVMRFHSQGLWKRLYIMFEAWRNRKNVNHITGDIHFVGCLLNRRKTILTIHDCGYAYHKAPLIRFIYKWFWLKFPVMKADYVTVVSEYTRREVLKHTNIKEDKVILIPNFVSNLFKPQFKPFNKLKPVLLQIGIHHNLDQLIEAIKGINCHLSIVGNPTKTQKKKLIDYKIEHSVKFDLSMPEIVRKYQSCDIVTFVSGFEGFGLPIIEANAMEKPVITGNGHAIPEIASNSACMVDPYSIVEIRLGLLKIIHNDHYRENLIKNGKLNALKYNAESSINKYKQLYLRVSGQKLALDNQNHRLPKLEYGVAS